MIEPNIKCEGPEYTPIETPMPIFKLLTGKIERATSESAAFDLFYGGNQPLMIGDKAVVVPTGVRTIIPAGFYAKIYEKSGLGAKGIEVKAGLIDADYRDEWGVILRKPMDLTLKAGKELEITAQWTEHQINPGDKIAQFVIVRIPKLQFTVEPGAEIIMKAVAREGGFGSTGK